MKKNCDMKKKMRLFKKYMNEGFTLVETILSLLVITFSITILTLFLSVCKKEDLNLTYKETESSIMQMQKLYVLSENSEVENEMWVFELYGEEMHFEEISGKLVLTPGYQVFFMGLDSVYFEEKEDCIYIHIQNEGYKKERIIGCE